MTHKLQHVPVEDIVVGETLSVEKIPEELPEIGVVWLVVEAQRATQIQVGGELGCQTQEETTGGCYKDGLGLKKMQLKPCDTQTHTHTRTSSGIQNTFSAAESQKTFHTHSVCILKQSRL